MNAWPTEVVPTAFPAMVVETMEIQNGQSMQIDLAAPRACQAEPQGSAQTSDPAAVFTWSEEKLLELATSLPAMRTIRHQPRGLRQRTCTILKKHVANITRIAITHGPSDGIVNPSRLRLLQPDGPGWVPNCSCGLLRAANMRMAEN